MTDHLHGIGVRPMARPTGLDTLREVAVTATALWRAPEVVRPGLDDPMLAGDPDAWATALDTDLRRELDGRLDTQLLLGEPVQVLEERDGYSRVVAPWQASRRDVRGYPGWVISAHLAAPADEGDGALVVATGPATPLTLPDGTTVTATLGTVVPRLATTGDQVEVALPGGRRAVAPARALIPLPADVTADKVVATARGFLGLGYLWGGLTVYGLDCSGLVHLSCRRHGWQVPRDAHDQEIALPPADPERPGDLYFFGSEPGQAAHVGFVTGDKEMLDAPMTGGVVTQGRLSEARLSRLLGAGRLA